MCRKSADWIFWGGVAILLSHELGVHLDAEFEFRWRFVHVVCFLTRLWRLILKTSRYCFQVSESVT